MTAKPLNDEHNDKQANQRGAADPILGGNLLKLCEKLLSHWK
jgi:hypothetical protein